MSTAEHRRINTLRSRMLDPRLFAEFCTAYIQETNRLRMASRAKIAAAESELERIAREVEKLMDLYLKDAFSIGDVKDRGDRLRARKAELTLMLKTAAEPLRYFTLQWLGSTEYIGRHGKVAIEVRGDLAGILTLSAKTKNPAERAGFRK